MATAPDRKNLRKESWFQGVSSCLKSCWEAQAIAKGAYEVPHAMEDEAADGRAGARAGL